MRRPLYFPYGISVVTSSNKSSDFKVDSKNAFAQSLRPCSVAQWSWAESVDRQAN